MQIQPYNNKTNKSEAQIVHEERKFDPDFPIHIPKRIYYSPDVAPSYMHYHNYFEIGMCVKGSGIFFIDSGIYPFGAGCISLIYPGEIHIAQSTNDDASLWIFITVSTDVLYKPDTQTGKTIHDIIYSSKGRLIKGGENMLLSQLLDRFIGVLRSMEGYYREYSAALLSSIIFETEASRTECVDEAIVHKKNIGIISPAVIYITGHYADKFKTDKLCGLCHISEVHLRRIFAEILGMSPFEYLYKIRINRACSALANTDKSISNISFDVGYTTITSFNRHFKDYTGMTPSEYRKKFNA